VTANERDGQPRGSRNPTFPEDEESGTRRLLWAAVGVVAYLAAKYVFGF
jgi:hypothetical protein